jgi:hypothetical protein
MTTTPQRPKDPAPILPRHPAYATQLRPTDAQVTRYRLALRALDGAPEAQADAAFDLIEGQMLALVIVLEGLPEVLAAHPEIAGILRQAVAVSHAWEEVCGLGTAVRR